MKISVKELKSRIRTAEKRASEPKYKSEEIIQNAAQRDKNMGKLWFRKLEGGVRRSNTELTRTLEAEDRENVGRGGNMQRNSS